MSARRRGRAIAPAAVAIVALASGRALAQDAASVAPSSAPPAHDVRHAGDVLRPSDGTVALEIRSTGAPLDVRVPPDGAGGLQSREAGRHFVEVCQTPCTLYVPRPTFTFETGGGRMRLGHHAIEVPSEPTTVTIRPSSSSVAAIGYSLLFSGLVTGSFAFGYSVAAAERWYYQPPALRTDAFAAGMISGASFAAMGLGIAFLAAQREPRIVRANVRNGEREVAVVEARRAPAPSRRRGALIGVGVGLLVIGLGVNGFFAALLTGVGHSPVGAYWAVPVVGGLASTAIADYRGDCRNDSCAPFWGLAFADLVLETAAIGLIAYGGWGGSRSRGSAPHVALAPGAAGAPIGATLGGAFF